MERNKESSKDASLRTTSEASSETPQVAVSSHQTPDHPTQAPKLRTLTNKPRSTPLMAALKLDDSSRTAIWTSKEISTTSLSDSSNVKPAETPPSVSESSETKMCHPDLKTLTGSPVPACDLTDKTVLSPLPLTTTEARLGPSSLFEKTTSESSPLPHLSRPSFSLRSNASQESRSSTSMASDSGSSTTESYKTPVAARKEVVIAMDDNDGKIIHPSEKSEGEVLNVAKDACKGSIKEQAVITMGLDDEEECSVKSESESFREEVINRSQEAAMKNTTTGDAIIDIMGSDNDNEETSAINEKSNDGKSLFVRSIRYLLLSFPICVWKSYNLPTLIVQQNQQNGRGWYFSIRCFSLLPDMQ